MTEVRFKLLQLGHTRRADELEGALQSGGTTTSPRILSAFGEESALNNASRRWRKALTWPQVMFPHVVFVALSLAAAIWLLTSKLIVSLR